MLFNLINKFMKPRYSQKLSMWGFERDSDGAIEIEGISIIDLVDEFETPLHVVSKKKIIDEVTDFKKTFVKEYEDTTILYAYKAGSIPGVLEVIHQNDIGAEVISGFELWLALKMKVPPEMIIFNGPVKTNDDLRVAIKNEIYAINIDSADDLARVEEVAGELGIPANIGLRLAAEGGYSNYGIIPGSNRFFELMERIKQSELLIYKGLMTHLGGRSTNAYIFKRGIKIMSETAALIKSRYGLKSLFFDVGGGFGITTSRGIGHLENAFYRKFNTPLKPPPPDLYDPLETVARETADALRSACDDHGLDYPKLILEPGRTLVSKPQVLLLKVHAVKSDNKQPVAITDGGRFNITYPVDHEYHEIFLANRNSQDEQYPYFLAGRISTIGDFVNRNKTLPKLKTNDILAIMDSGAYFTQFSSNFSFTRPAIVMIDEGIATLIRKRESYEHLVSLDLNKN